MCKPDMTLFKTGSVTDHPSFITWRTAISNLSTRRKTFIKLSGSFSEIPKEFKDAPAEDVFEAIKPWLLVVLEAFSPSRIMFGSDWPVCNIGGGTTAWEKWRWIAQRLCQEGNLSREDETMLWSGTAIKAYGIKQLM
jgi:L-rhamnono-1,4-lactonase